MKEGEMPDYINSVWIISWKWWESHHQVIDNVNAILGVNDISDVYKLISHHCQNQQKAKISYIH